MHAVQSGEGAADWAAALKAAIRKQTDRPRSLLVFLNPFGGAKQAQSVWDSIANPVMQLAGPSVTPLQQRFLVGQLAGPTAGLRLQRRSHTVEMRCTWKPTRRGTASTAASVIDAKLQRCRMASCCKHELEQQHASEDILSMHWHCNAQACSARW